MIIKSNKEIDQTWRSLHSKYKQQLSTTWTKPSVGGEEEPNAVADPVPDAAADPPSAQEEEIQLHSSSDEDSNF